ncbi:hypothetical protein PHLGIDRAFT_110595 [Phlebiopsis gigantea 11061_1 CR5-6]|uniref:Major facilitator superfamily (MFS) profile domain-containing protein n=1 Tax=Phlebiopsis gigantea (strain 11061_1 CR5-6) TaxID=745531 RepID=A0A0C3S5N3_PHLG1|nr:hypothetical protein PHLGIDRAFT_110595 [Phlebiopsis gigantea 11061_1 CR5-6]
MRSMDLFGMTFLVVWITLLIVALNLGGDAYAWNSPVIIGLLAGTGTSFIAFLVAENKASHPVVPMGLFASWKYRNVPIITVARTLLFFHLFASTFYIPVFLQVTGHSSTLAAALVIPFLFTAAIASSSTNYYASRSGVVRPPFWVGLAILPIGMGLMTTLHEGSSLGQVVAYTIICGMGFGSGTVVTMVIPQAGLPSDLLPTVTAFVSALPNLGGVLGVGIVGTVINNKFRARVSAFAPPGYPLARLNDAVAAARDPVLGPQIVAAYVAAFQLGFRILAGIAVLQLILCLGLGRVVLDAANAGEEKVELVSIAADDKGTDDKLDECRVQGPQREKNVSAV